MQEFRIEQRWVYQNLIACSAKTFASTAVPLTFDGADGWIPLQSANIRESRTFYMGST